MKLVITTRQGKELLTALDMALDLENYTISDKYNQQTLRLIRKIIKAMPEPDKSEMTEYWQGLI